MTVARRYPDRRGWSMPDRYGRRLLISRWNPDKNETSYAAIED